MRLLNGFCDFYEYIHERCTSSVLMSAYRLVTHRMLPLSSALPYVSLVNDPVKRAGVLPLNPFDISGLTGVMKDQNTVIRLIVFKANNCFSETIMLAEVTCAVHRHTQERRVPYVSSVCVCYVKQVIQQ